MALNGVQDALGAANFQPHGLKSMTPAMVRRYAGIIHNLAGKLGKPVLHTL